MLFQRRQFQEATVKLEEAARVLPNDASIQNLLGTAYTKLRDYSRAEACFERALDLDSTFFPAKFNQGELIFLQGRYPQALEHFSAMLRDDPANSLLQFKVVLCLLKTDQLEEARKMAKRIPLLNEDPAWQYAQAAIAMQEGNKRKAAKYVANAAVLYPGRDGMYRETFQDLGWPTE